MRWSPKPKTCQMKDGQCRMAHHGLGTTHEIILEWFKYVRLRTSFCWKGDFTWGIDWNSFNCTIRVCFDSYEVHSDSMKCFLIITDHNLRFACDWTRWCCCTGVFGSQWWTWYRWEWASTIGVRIKRKATWIQSSQESRSHECFGGLQLLFPHITTTCNPVPNSS